MSAVGIGMMSMGLMALYGLMSVVMFRVFPSQNPVAASQRTIDIIVCTISVCFSVHAFLEIDPRAGLLGLVMLFCVTSVIGMKIGSVIGGMAFHLDPVDWVVISAYAVVMYGMLVVFHEIDRQFANSESS